MRRNEIGKELIIALLTLIAVMLVMFAILYSFSPYNKVMPEEIEYKTAEDVQAELQSSTGISPENVISTYELGQNELYTYQATNDYRPGKVNPFSSYVVQEDKKDEDGQTTEKSTSGTNNSSSAKSGTTSGSGNSADSGNVDRSKPIAPGEVNPGNYEKSKGLK